MAGEKLAAVGPIDPENGFPRWYEDGNEVRLELGLDPGDPNIAALEVPPGKISFPDNYPGEAFYFLAEAELPIGGPAGNGRAKLVLGLEATFAGAGEPAPSQQIVFGRTRLRIQNGRPGTQYTFTHPYGTHTESADDRGKVDVTVDIGVAPGQFGDALASGVAPFLRWTSGAERGAGEVEAPEGYLGSAGTPHTVTGSPEGNNFFRVEGIGAATGSEEPEPETVQTTLFSLQGKLAVEIGAQVDRAVRPEPGIVDVFASSAPGQELVVTGHDVPVTVMRGADRSYVARVSTSANEVVVLNRTRGGRSDLSPVVDLVVIESATFDLDAVPPVLRVRARSSGAAPLDLAGFGPLTSGVEETFEVGAPPATVHVRVGKDILASRDVVVDGAASASEPPTAVVEVRTAAGVRSLVTPGEELTLDSTRSTGGIREVLWEADRGDVPDTKAEMTTLTVPEEPGPVSVRVTVTDGADRQDSQEVELRVDGTRPPVARPGADRPADVGDPVVLDASESPGARAFAWSVPDTATATIEAATTARPTVTLHAGGPTSVRLTVTGPGGEQATDTVVLTGRPGVVAVTGAEYRSDKKQWRVRGRVTGPDPARRVPDRVEVSVRGTSIGSVVSDADGAWSLTAGLVGRPPLDGDPVTVRSSRGGVAQAPLSVRR